ncbi:MAG: hypothetical protein WC107_03855 [Patescibacteria group bacterium]
MNPEQFSDVGVRQPKDMSPMDIPSGVDLHENKLLDDQGRAIFKYGLERMLAGSIRTFGEEPDSPAEYTDGSLLIFQPGYFYVHVAKRDLAAEEINSIGQLVADLDIKYSYHEYLAKAVKQLDEIAQTAKPLELSRARVESEYIVGEKSNTGFADDAMNKELADLGVIAGKMRERLPVLHAEILSIQTNLKELGVSLIRSQTGDQTGGRAFPIGLVRADIE